MVRSPLRGERKRRPSYRRRPVFRRVMRGDRLTDARLGDRSVALVLKKHAARLVSIPPCSPGPACAPAAFGRQRRRSAPKATSSRSRGSTMSSTCADTYAHLTVLHRRQLPPQDSTLTMTCAAFTRRCRSSPAAMHAQRTPSDPADADAPIRVSALTADRVISITARTLLAQPTAPGSALAQ